MDVPRVEDFLNDKIQAFADFDTLDTLLANVQSQQSLLKQQLEEAEHALRQAENESTALAAEARRKAAAFDQEQSSIDNRLMAITKSDTISEAVQRFEPFMKKLRSLEIADKYTSLLEKVDQLRQSVLDHSKASPDEAIAAHHQIRAISANLKALQQDAEGAAPHLVDWVDTVVAHTRDQLRDAYAADFEAVLNKILWPKKSTALPASLEQEFNSAVTRLLVLQKPELESFASQSDDSSGAVTPPVLLPLQVMADPLAARFGFHFSGDRPTNRPDKPEYFLSHFLELLDTHNTFVSDYVQPVLFQTLRDSSALTVDGFLDAPTAFISALMPMLTGKISALVSQISDHPGHLSHLMHELMIFDATLSDEWRYDGGYGRSGTPWRGTAWEVLTTQGLFDHWLHVEQEFAIGRYQTIIDDTTAMTLDYDSVSSNSTKPTSAALRVHDLITTITATYRPLTSLSQKLRFLMDIQITLLDRFHDRLRSALQAFESKTSTVGRTVQGVTAAELAELQGVSGLDRLCRVFGSAEFLEKAMRDWSDDIFFLDLWNELQCRVQDRAVGSPVAGSLGIADIAAKTSSALANDDDTEDMASGALFDETAASYAALRKRAEGLIVNSVRRALQDAFGPYAKSAAFAGDAVAATAQADLTPTSSLSGMLSVLQSTFDFLDSALSPVALRRISRSLVKTVDDLIFDRVILAKDFSQHGARQLACDLTAISRMFDRFTVRGAGSSGLRRSSDAATLLNLSAVDENAQGTEGEETNGATLWSTEKSLFASNEDARTALAELELSNLTEAEARKVVKCRLELSD